MKNKKENQKNLYILSVINNYSINLQLNDLLADLRLIQIMYAQIKVIILFKCKPIKLKIKYNFNDFTIAQVQITKVDRVGKREKDR